MFFAALALFVVRLHSAGLPKRSSQASPRRETRISSKPVQTNCASGVFRANQAPPAAPLLPHVKICSGAYPSPEGADSYRKTTAFEPKLKEAQIARLKGGISPLHPYPPQASKKKNVTGFVDGDASNGSEIAMPMPPRSNITYQMPPRADLAS